MKILIEHNEGEQVWYAEIIAGAPGIMELREHGARPEHALRKVFQLAAQNEIEIPGGRKAEITGEDIASIDTRHAKQSIDRLRLVVDAMESKSPTDVAAFTHDFREAAELVDIISAALRVG